MPTYLGSNSPPKGTVRGFPRVPRVAAPAKGRALIATKHSDAKGGGASALSSTFGGSEAVTGVSCYPAVANTD